MNPEEQRIAIADACGWTHIETLESNNWQYGWPPRMVNPRYVSPIPDFCNDLNAMHEAEKVIPKEKLDDYHYHLAGIVSNWSGEVKASVYKSVFATASQRAEAFLKTIGKWKD